MKDRIKKIIILVFLSVVMASISGCMTPEERFFMRRYKETFEKKEYIPIAERIRRCNLLEEFKNGEKVSEEDLYILERDVKSAVWYSAQQKRDKIQADKLKKAIDKAKNDLLSKINESYKAKLKINVSKENIYGKGIYNKISLEELMIALAKYNFKIIAFTDSDILRVQNPDFYFLNNKIQLNEYNDMKASNIEKIKKIISFELEVVHSDSKEKFLINTDIDLSTRLLNLTEYSIPESMLKIIYEVDYAGNKEMVNERLSFVKKMKKDKEEKIASEKRERFEKIKQKADSMKNKTFVFKNLYLGMNVKDAIFMLQQNGIEENGFLLHPDVNGNVIKFELKESALGILFNLERFDTEYFKTLFSKAYKINPLSFRRKYETERLGDIAIYRILFIYESEHGYRIIIENKESKWLNLSSSLMDSETTLLYVEKIKSKSEVINSFN